MARLMLSLGSMKACLSAAKKLKLWHVVSATLTLVAIVAALATASATLSSCCEVLPDGTNNCSCVEIDSTGHCVD